MSSLIEKHRTEIRRRLRDIFQVKFIESNPLKFLRYHGGGDKKEEKKERKEKKKEELAKDSPFSYFIHIELDIIPGKHDPSGWFNASRANDVRLRLRLSPPGG